MVNSIAKLDSQHAESYELVCGTSLCPEMTVYLVMVAVTKIGLWDRFGGAYSLKPNGI